MTRERLHLPNPFRSPFTVHHSRAFTVVELSVVLVVLGVILTSVLKLEQVYRNYRIRVVMNQARELNAAVKVYRDRFGYWPGDDPMAVVHVGLTGPSVTHYGDGNDVIDTTTNEYNYVFEHLSKAGLIKGSYDGNTTRFDKHTFGGYIQILNWYGVANCVRLDDLPFDVAFAVEVGMDDQSAGTGLVRANKYYNPTDWAKTSVSAPPSNYQSQMALLMQ